ncbi:MAG: hypothetical protein LQ350_007875 [Teloschistes chrysophthalmus]|nr:MAG: hypothetical protein LQ350_007875 [Niorma chrysophthalma]
MEGGISRILEHGITDDGDYFYNVERKGISGSKWVGEHDIEREPNGTEILVDFIYLISEAELAAKQHEGGSPKDEGSSPQV